MPKFGDYTASTAPNQGDLLLIKDINTNSTKKITRSNLLVGTALPTNTVTTAAITDAAVTSAKLSGINKSLLTTDSNPYKFSAYLSSGQTVANADVKITCQTELFDTNSNYDNVTNFRYVAPVTGFYFFNAAATTFIGNGNVIIAKLFKNGVIAKRGSWASNNTGGANTITSNVSAFLSLTASDYVELYTNHSQVSTSTINGTLDQTYFEGYLICRT
jgi:hypothetical protein